MNGAAGDAGAKPLFSVKRNTPVVLAIKNATPAIQPLHLHGHVFRLLHPFDDGWEPYFLDTVQVPENRTVRIAFQADNPGQVADRLDGAGALRHRAVDLVRGDLSRAADQVIPEDCAQRGDPDLAPPRASAAPPATPPAVLRDQPRPELAAPPPRGIHTPAQAASKAGMPCARSPATTPASTSPEPAVAR